jgi:hypothetical protein
MPVSVGAKAGQRVHGIVPGSLDLNTYLGTWSEVPTSSRPAINVYLAPAGQDESRVVVELMDNRRFEFTMLGGATAEDQAIFDRILASIIFPYG